MLTAASPYLGCFPVPHTQMGPPALWETLYLRVGSCLWILLSFFKLLGMGEDTPESTPWAVNGNIDLKRLAVA